MSPLVLVIDDSRDLQELLAVWLTAEGLAVQSASNAADGLRLAQVERPDLVLLDVELPESSGFDLCRRLKNDTATSEIPVIFVTGSSKTRDKVMGLDLGAVDYVTKPFDPHELGARVRAALRTKRYQDLLARRAQIDGLTGLRNRAFFDECLRRELESSRRYRTPLCLLLFDVDHFKRLNDTGGHPLGDRALQHLGELFSQSIGPGGSACRYGGEEFAVILPGASLELARDYAESVRSSVAELPVAGRSGPQHISISGGVVSSEEWPDDYPLSPGELLETADRALYIAKTTGRNRIVTFGSALTAQREPSRAAATDPCAETALTTIGLGAED